MVFEKDRESKKIEEKLKYQKRRENPKPIRDKIRNKRERSESESDAADRRPSKKGKISEGRMFIVLIIA